MKRRRQSHHKLSAIKAAFSEPARIKPVVKGRELYVKFTLDARGELLLISFKENEG